MLAQSAFSNVSKQGYLATIHDLKTRGYDVIHQPRNTFALCLARPDENEVVIVNTETDCALVFYKMCQANKHNPYLPRIHEIVEGEGVYLIRAERLVALDHLSLSADDEARLKARAQDMVSFIRAEDGGKSLLHQDPLACEAARLILECADTIYRQSNGQTFAFCDLKETNVFMRPVTDGAQFVFGDPLLPGMGKGKHFPDNLSFMNRVRQTFHLPALRPISE